MVRSSLRATLKKISIFMSLGVLVLTSSPVSALSEADYLSQGIKYLGQEEAICSGSFVAGPSVSGTDNIAKMWNYLVQKGLSGQQAAGILGNIQQESGFQPARQEVGGGGWGIVQWTGGRRTAVKNFIASKNPSLAKYESNTSAYGGGADASTGYVHPNVPIEDNDLLLALELDFLYEESIVRKVTGLQQTTSEQRRTKSSYGGKTEWEAIKAAPSIKDASNIWLFSFERPRDQSNKHAADRAALGQVIFDRLSGGGGGIGVDILPEGETGTVKGPCGTLPNSQGFAGKVVDYVISDWHAKPWWGSSKAKPAYVAAADKAVRDGRYVGNGASKWYADCGGFVTTLMIDSGFDPTYNHSSKVSQGAGPTGTQHQWLEANWQNLGKGGSVDTASLQPGDVFIREGHTFVYIGEVPGINSNIASSSNMERVPMAGAESLTDSSGSWYRIKGGVTNAE